MGTARHIFSLLLLVGVRVGVGVCVGVGVIASVGCVHSYRSEAPLSFDEISYVGTASTAVQTYRVELEDAPSRYGMTNALGISYVDLNPSGDPTVVFVHGLGAYAKWWRYQFDAFAAAGYHVVALDLPGHGGSDKPASFPYTAEAMGDVVVELLDRMGIRDPILIGHSMGGQVLLSLAIRFPTLARALVLTSPAGFEPYSERERAWFRSAYSVRLMEDASEYAVWRTYRYLSFNQWTDAFAWIIEERMRLSKSVGPFQQHLYAIIKSIWGLSQTDFVRENLGQIRAPTLIIYGEADRLIPNPYLHGGSTGAIMAYGHAHIPLSVLTPLADCGHAVQIDCSSRYNATVLAWLASARSRGSLRKGDSAIGSPGTAR
ncbi:MAG: alpha/beta hydrolase [Deltaproteobacteria bacterium]|nr:alpha/beta hydrolase [Deltaproteobacteria bacterium]